MAWYNYCVKQTQYEYNDTNKQMRRIIVVDDNEDILEVIKLILEGYDYEVLTLNDGNLLIGQIQDYQPDLILLDIMLGNMDGRDLCKVLRSNKDTCEIPIILVSASHNLSDHSTDAHVDFLAKPFDITELMAKVVSNLAAA